ncbi:MAG: phosphoribosylanthranilate isomerase [Actinomycetota bacterium]
MAEPPRVKVCGVTLPEQARACAEAGAWAIGVVLAEGSPRRVDAEGAARVLAAVPDGVARVGVFVGATPAEMAAVAARAGMTHVQVHGGCDPDEVAAATGCRVIEAFSVSGPQDVERARASAADLVLLDAAVRGLHGGTGRRFDWSILADTPPGRPFALAGGLTPDNVADAVAAVRPDVVDVASGVEARPGVKDLRAVALFIARARAAVAVAG